MAADNRKTMPSGFWIKENIGPEGKLVLNDAARSALVRIFGPEALGRVRKALEEKAAAEAEAAAAEPQPKAE